jgi:hypothetical protein
MTARKAVERSSSRVGCIGSRREAEASNTVVKELVTRMSDPRLLDGEVIPWSSPVPAFGNLATARIATLGINPSNREFVDQNGKELDGAMRRFPTLRSLGLHSWRDATVMHYDLIDRACRQYFFANPYDTWFRKLDRVIRGTGASYYTGSACHLDLIPYATGCKWTELAATQRENLLQRAGDTLGLLLRNSSVQLIVLNGRSVVDRFEAMTSIALKRRVFPNWALPRRSEADVEGVGYEGKVDVVAGIALARSISVLGFNHNIQSSFGVTRSVIEAIASWVTRSARTCGNEKT